MKMQHPRPKHTMPLRAVPLALVALSLTLSSTALADEPSADEIARKVLRADSANWEGAHTTVRMVLHDKGGKTKERAMEIFARRSGGLLQTLVRFTAPSELAGTAFLMLEKKGEPSEQYVYLSGLKRVRRVVGREREGSFMGSDFSYQDMQPIDPKHATHTRKADDKVGNSPTYVLESVLSQGSGSPYGKVETWVRKSDFVALRTRFYDRKGKLVKTLYARKVKQIDGRPVITESRMQDAATGHATELVVQSSERKDDLPESMFTPNSLERL